jgi:crossover junction endodeoxyribonuclease RusA
MMPAIADMEAEASEVLGVRIVLPWPDKRLSPNARVHWRGKVKPKKEARSDAYYIACRDIGRRLGRIRTALAGKAPIPVLITFLPPDNRRRDRDNMQASLKHALDGVADALKVDDNRFRPTYAVASACSPGWVRLEL